MMQSLQPSADHTISKLCASVVSNQIGFLDPSLQIIARHIVTDHVTECRIKEDMMVVQTDKAHQALLFC